MTNLKIKLEFNKGRRGIPLFKLISMTDETLKFLDMTCEDIGISKDRKNWTASNFSNGSVAFDCEYDTELKPEIMRKYIRVVHDIITKPHEVRVLHPFLRKATLLQYARITEEADANEIVRFGFYTNGTKLPRWTEFAKADAIKIVEELSKMAEYYGQIQGIIHSFYKEADPPYLTIRELSSKALINCSFENDLYNDAVSLLKDKKAIIFVEGQVVENLITGLVESIRASKFYPAPDFSREDFDSFFGCCPNLTASQTTEEYIREVRANER
jgi:hypothetical protein